MNGLHDLGFTVTAEGVETEDMVKGLRAMGCDYFQGFYYSRPISMEEFLENMVRIKIPPRRDFIESTGMAVRYAVSETQRVVRNVRLHIHRRQAIPSLLNPLNPLLH